MITISIYLTSIELSSSHLETKLRVNTRSVVRLDHEKLHRRTAPIRCRLLQHRLIDPESGCDPLTIIIEEKNNNPQPGVCRCRPLVDPAGRIV